MKIKLNTSEDTKIAIRKAIPVTEVFSVKSMKRFTDGIVIDFIDGVENQWHDYRPASEYDLDTYKGHMELERDAINYALYATELTYYDFLQEFVDHIASDYQAEDYGKFEDQLTNGEITVTLSEKKEEEN